MPSESLVPQLPLALRYPPDQRFETWQGDAAVLTQLRALATGEGSDAPSVDSVYLQGASGSGKTHLLLAACAAAEAAGRHANYVPLARLRGHAADALPGIERADLVALDDLDALAGHRDDEIALFDLHNRVRDAGIALVYAARETPAALPLQLPDLRSRLSQCTRIALHALDDAGRANVLRQRAQARGLMLDEAAIDWLLTRTHRDLAALAGVLDRLDRASLAAKRRVTVPFLKQVIGP